jgi:GntR family transcriptional regulator/MocR family aminotransferase
MHLALRFTDPALSDTAISAQARAHGIVARPLSEHAVQGETGWHGLMLGYAQVPAEQMDGLVRQLAALVHLAAYAQDGRAMKKGSDPRV